MKNPIKRKQPRYFVADFINNYAVRFDDLEKYGTWFNPATKRWNNPRWPGRTFSHLKRFHPELREIKPTTKLIRTGRP